MVKDNHAKLNELSSIDSETDLSLVLSIESTCCTQNDFCEFGRIMIQRRELLVQYNVEIIETHAIQY